MILNKEAMKQARLKVQEELQGRKGFEDDSADYNAHLQAGEVEAVRALRRILAVGKSDSAIVSAANALLDRAKGKPVQSTVIEQNTTYTIISAIPAAPNSLTSQRDADIL